LVAVGVFRRLSLAEPLCVTTIYLPPSLGDVVASDPRSATAGARSKTTVIALLEEAMAVGFVAGATQSITAAIAGAKIATLIGAKQGDAMLSVERMYFDAEGKPIELAISHFNVQHYTYRLELRRSAR
jgi:DNA-binding GntR family transcriptional regulator